LTTGATGFATGAEALGEVEAALMAGLVKGAATALVTGLLFTADCLVLDVAFAFVKPDAFVVFLVVDLDAIVSDFRFNELGSVQVE